ncbi:hypothetical protein BDF19DRAFT_417236 [Syncephalis fuscata]|nr:hypothetical protein BDF19DRAFT_417236 [Syncephalis fuscata]
MTSTFDKGNTYTTPKAHIADMSTFEGTEKKRRTTPKGIDGEEHNGRGREGSTPSHDTYRKRLYSQVVAEPSSANIGLGINAYDKTRKMETPKYAENTHFKPPPPPPPYAPELPAPAVPAQHVQGRYFYGDIADPYSESYSNNFSNLNRREMYHKEMYQQETPSDFQDIQYLHYGSLALFGHSQSIRKANDGELSML